MGTLKALDRALLLRRSAHLRSREPSRVFINRLREPRKLLGLVEASAASPATKRECRRLFVVAVAAAFEAFWREFIRVNLDRCRIPPASIEHLRHASFSLADVQKIVGRKLTLGELISSIYPLQGTQAVNTALTEILDTKAFSSFAAAEFSIREVPRKNRKKGRPLASTIVAGKEILKANCAHVDQCFTIRHVAYRISDADVHRLESAAWQFNTFLGMHMETCFAQRWKSRGRTSS